MQLLAASTLEKSAWAEEREETTMARALEMEMVATR